MKRAIVIMLLTATAGWINSDAKIKKTIVKNTIEKPIVQLANGKTGTFTSVIQRLSADHQSTMKVIEHGLNRAARQSLLLSETLQDRKGELPCTFEKGKLKTIGYNHWTSGFFPGVLWMLYENSGNHLYRHYAELFTERVEPAKRLTTTHDLGFMLYCSFGQGYRLTCNKHYLNVIMEGTQSLMTRWNPKLGVIKSWDFGDKWQYPVII